MLNQLWTTGPRILSLSCDTLRMHSYLFSSVILIAGCCTKRFSCHIHLLYPLLKSSSFFLSSSWKMLSQEQIHLVRGLKALPFIANWELVDSPYVEMKCISFLTIILFVETPISSKRLLPLWLLVPSLTIQSSTF